jgi:hypothetical protein
MEGWNIDDLIAATAMNSSRSQNELAQPTQEMNTIERSGPPRMKILDRPRS